MLCLVMIVDLCASAGSRSCLSTSLLPVQVVHTGAVRLQAGAPATGVVASCSCSIGEDWRSVPQRQSLSVLR